MKNYYKYLKIKRAISYSENECLRFTQAADLNDPFECLPKKQINNSFLNSILRRLKSRSNTVSDKLIENTMKSVVANIKNETPNNIFDIFYRNQYEDLNNEIGILSDRKSVV